ncbi:MAG: hypothetical protein L0228_12670 [Planctomycetes bacterium]|nr:hypothetical protein [Planctomycetota bacterium]
MLIQCVGFRALLRATILALVAAVMVVPAGVAFGQEAENAGEGSDAKVPVKRVVLFNSGVGYIEHSGKVEGDASVDLKFNVDDINDLLKSMVLQDLDGGQISTVTYGSRDPITKTLQSFAIDLTQNPTLGQLLAQIRGERVELEAPTKIFGTIVGVEKKREYVAADKVFVETEYLNVLTDDGLRRIALDSVGRIKLASKELDKEFRQALAVLARGHATDKKTVTLKFLGEGERDVRVGYIQEAPVWKTSYRLVLDDEDKPFLQGWAIVENTTDTDWQDVRLSLVSGRPISFVMDLYSPLYAQRPVVVPELFASLRPQMYEQDLKRKGELRSLAKRFDKSVARDAAAPAAPEIAAEDQMAFGRAAGVGGGGFGGDFLVDDGRSTNGAFTRSSLEASVQAAAQGGDVGELFQYDIKDAVTLARQRSAMLPIINDKIEGTKVSIYNVGVHAKHPLNGIELKNSSDLHLMQGPVTVFDGGVYAGDARIPDLPPGSDRLLSYALDLDVEVAPTSDSRPQDLLSVRIEKGVLIANYKQSRTQRYTVKNSGDKEKRVLIEYGFDPRWELIASKKPTEKTRDVYRFAVAAGPGKPADLRIEEQQSIRQDVAINNLNDEAIRFYLSAKVVSETVKDALREVVRRKTELADLSRRKQQFDQEIATIGQEQQRIRENMRSIDRNTDLYNRYVKKFTDQEDQIERLRENARELESKIAESQRSIDEYLSELVLG